MVRKDSCLLEGGLPNELARRTRQRVEEEIGATLTQRVAVLLPLALALARLAARRDLAEAANP